MGISTVHLTAKDVMDSVVALLNDPQYTDFTVKVQLPYLNLACEELNQHLEESNVAISNQVSEIIPVPTGRGQIENPPIDIIEIQEVAERVKGTNDAFISLPRREFTDLLPVTNSLLFWVWKNQRIYFNPNGANGEMEVRIKYISKPIRFVHDENSAIGNANGLVYLAYKTAALIALFVSENESRAAVLNEEAEKALERIIGISNKGRQEIMTRHRPFRAGYKTRSY
jgi:hypothetical protein